MQKTNHEIPILDWQSNAGNYKEVKVNLEDPREKEPLVRLKDYGISGQNFYARTDGNNWPYHTRIEGSLNDLWCRKQVAEKLVRIRDQLKPQGVDIYVLDAYRAIACQQGLWDFFSRQALKIMPEASDAERRNYVLTCVSDPTRFKRDDSTTWPVHASGGAIDLTLRDCVTGDLLDMGARFDEADPVSSSDYYERLCKTDATEKNIKIRDNRRLLYNAMREEGFVNYPHEFWHYDWGDQMYVFNSGHLYKDCTPPAAAWYGYCDPPKE